MRAVLGYSVALAIVCLATSAAGQADVVPQSVWTKSADGSGSHLQSMLQCPATVGPFQLKSLTHYDAFGLDVGCDYWAGDSDITLYLSKRADNETLQSDFDGAKSAIPTHFPDAKPVDQAPPSPSSGSWLSAMFTIRNDAQRSGLWVADIGGWTFKFRATYSRARKTTS